MLLRNGNMLTGQVSHEGGRLRLVGKGREVWLETAHVATTAGSPEELYRWQREQFTPPTVQDHLWLANWCLKQALFPQASRELLDARALSPGDPRVTALERQMQQLAYPVQQASHTSVSAAGRGRPEMSDQQVAALPPGVLEDFTRHIQPVLVNNCTTSGCHLSGGDQPFQLNRQLMHGMADRHSTRANLAAVLKAIDQASPRNSPLLAAIQGPHAKRPTAAFTGPRAPLAEKVEAWVIATTTTTTTVDSQVKQASGVFALVKQQKERDRFIQQVNAVAPPRGFRDEFDPKIFNQKYR